MMDAQTFLAPAKLNLSLDVTGLLPDGYHEMKMILTSVTLCDEVSLKLGASGIRLAGGPPYLPTDERNLAYRAAKLFFEAAGMPEAGVEIHLKKRIPVGAGMAGGSTDAAAVLRGLNELTDAGLPMDTLCALGGQLGSDVPYCLYGETMLGLGRGDVLSPLPPMPDCHIVICKPRFPVSTPMLFSRLDGHKIRCRPDLDALIDALRCGDLQRIAQRMYNIFEDVLPPQQRREILQIKSRLLQLGALGAMMTGTGSAVFSLFASEDAARNAWSSLSAEYRDCFLAAPMRQNPDSAAE